METRRRSEERRRRKSYTGKLKRDNSGVRYGFIGRAQSQHVTKGEERESMQGNQLIREEEKEEEEERSEITETNSPLLPCELSSLQGRKHERRQERERRRK